MGIEHWSGATSTYIEGGLSPYSLGTWRVRFADWLFTIRQTETALTLCLPFSPSHF